MFYVQRTSWIKSLNAIQSMGEKDVTYNVCRPFVLYNDFLPPDTEPHREWQYLVLGYFDGIMVGGTYLMRESVHWSGSGIMIWSR